MTDLIVCIAVFVVTSFGMTVEVYQLSLNFILDVYSFFIQIWGLPQGGDTCTTSPIAPVLDTNVNPLPLVLSRIGEAPRSSQSSPSLQAPW